MRKCWRVTISMPRVVLLRSEKPSSVLLFCVSMFSAQREHFTKSIAHVCSNSFVVYLVCSIWLKFSPPQPLPHGTAVTSTHGEIFMSSLSAGKLTQILPRSFICVTNIFHTWQELFVLPSLSSTPHSHARSQAYVMWILLLVSWLKILLSDKISDLANAENCFFVFLCCYRDDKMMCVYRQRSEEGIERIYYCTLCLLLGFKLFAFPEVCRVEEFYKVLWKYFQEKVEREL